MITANCSNMGLIHVPQSLPRNINALDLSRNDIKGVTNDAFDNYQSLLELNLNSNKINHISNSSLNGLGNLQSLKMADNFLNLSDVYTMDLFVPLKKLNILNIMRNMDQPTNLFRHFYVSRKGIGCFTSIDKLID